MTAHLSLTLAFLLFLYGYSQLPPQEASLTSILAAFVLYVGIAVSNGRQGNWPLLVVWGAYSISQLGFAALEIQNWSVKK